MPLKTDTLAAISQWFMQHSPQSHLVHRDAPRQRELLDAACEMWAIRGLVGNRKTPVEAFDTILLGGSDPVLVKETQEIRDTFGRLDHYKIGRLGVASRDVRNKARPALHRLTSAVFRHCLAANGFKITDDSDYLVCMEYEVSRKQAMYPNFTHAWLAYRDAFVIQTVPNHYLSISMREAGRQPHCGILRCPVVDFLPRQLEVIEDMVANAVECQDVSRLVNCVFPIALQKDVVSPDE